MTIRRAEDQPVDLADLMGFQVLDEDDDDPVLLDRSGEGVDTWREGCPCQERNGPRRRRGAEAAAAPDEAAAPSAGRVSTSAG